MPLQQPQWTEFLSCPICFNVFEETVLRPISLGCGHTICKGCLSKLQQKKCPFDQSPILHSIDELPVNFALLQLVGAAAPDLDIGETVAAGGKAENGRHYLAAKRCIEALAMFLKPLSQGIPSSRFMDD